MPWWRQPPLRGHGRTAVAIGCTYELVALIPGSPLPTITEIVEHVPVLGVVLLLGLAHHFFIEQDDIA